VALNVGAYWDNLLTTHQARFLRAIETLARVRRLARNTPALQINIAREGGKQVNVQGDVNGQKAPPATDAQPEAMPTAARWSSGRSGMPGNPPTFGQWLPTHS
jgi:hypothetical protein